MGRLPREYEDSQLSPREILLIKLVAVLCGHSHLIATY